MTTITTTVAVDTIDIAEAEIAWFKARHPSGLAHKEPRVQNFHRSIRTKGGTLNRHFTLTRYIVTTAYIHQRNTK